MRSRRPNATRKVTFRSKIDGSIQYYGVQPAIGEEAGKALILSLHGAGVEAIGQAGSYARKSWAHVVAPTNRRPFGFDWEDWGRWDTLEVLEHAQRALATDPLRTYVVGHSMGGHGAWHLGVTFPDRFAALGPSAGWISFWSYTGADRYAGASPISKMFLRATSPSDTLRLAQNLRGSGIYILHGDADDNVPVAQARTMKEHLSKFHPGFGYHEEPGKKHWWNKSDEPGVDCVDWPPMMDYLSRRSLPGVPRQIDFTTASPGVSAHSHWVWIDQQERALEPSRVRIRVDPHKRRFVGTTENVALLSLDTDALARKDGPILVELDGQKIEFPKLPEPRRVPDTASRGAVAAITNWIHLVRNDGAWRNGEHPIYTLRRGKWEGRYGPFKNAFRSDVLFVYGTQGSDHLEAMSITPPSHSAAMANDSPSPPGRR